MPQPLYTAAQTRELDRRAIAAGTPGFELMLRAGRAAWQVARSRWPGARRIAVLCGGGNNGGDGFVLAALARREGLEVDLRIVGGERTLERLAGEAAEARRWAEARGVTPLPFDPEAPIQADLVVDALLGTGLDRPVRADFAAAIERINASGLPVLAIDLPSGLDADRGRVLGTAVRAHVTISFIGRKRGLYTGDGVEYAGERLFADLGVDPSAFADIRPQAWLLDEAALADWLPRRPRNSHKGLFGHLLLAGGDTGMGGAIAMAAEAALRAGAGLVSVATRAESARLCTLRQPEVMARAVRSLPELEPMLARATALVVGPGLGQGAWAGQLFHRLANSGLPLVLDADGLNLLARGEPEAPAQQADRILTPHPGEAARLLGCTTAEIQADRFAAVKELQRRYGGVVVLKGAGTLIADPDQCLVCAAGNPGMASGGMGDVLAGVIGALLAQGLEPLRAAALGVLAHALAADRLAHRHGERGLLAGDLPPVIRELLNPDREYS